MYFKWTNVLSETIFCLLFYKTNGLIHMLFLQNDPNFLEKCYRSQQEGF